MKTKVKPKQQIKRTVQKLYPKKSVIHKHVTVSPTEILDTKMEHLDTLQSEIVPPVLEIVQPVLEIVQPEIKTESSDSLLNDLMSQTDKDNEAEKEDDDIFENETKNDDIETDIEKNIESKGKDIADKLTDSINNDNDDWQNPTDFKKTCQVKALMYTEVGAIMVSFLGQAISGDWTPEGEKKYMPSEDRRKLIRAPLAKKFELNKDRSPKTPTGALITAIIFTIIPIIIIAFKSRKQKINDEIKKLESDKLKNELNLANEEIRSLRSLKPVTTRQTSKTIVKGRGRHKLNCDCDRCNLKKIKKGI